MTESSGTENDKAQPVVSEPYKERDDFVPSPYAQYGTLQTSGASGDTVHEMRDISPVFDDGRVQNLKTALKAIDPEDNSVSPDLVPVAEGKTTDEVRADLEAALAEYQDDSAKDGPEEQADGKHTASSAG